VLKIEDHEGRAIAEPLPLFMRPNLIKGKLMRKNTLPLFLFAIAAALVATGCAHCGRDADTNTTACARARSYKSPPEAVRQPGTPDNPCGEVLVREPTLEPKRTLVNEGDPDREHYWVTAFWAKTSVGDWVFIPAHAEPSPGSRWIPGSTNAVAVIAPVRQASL
jgi:hypothetical protein